LSYRRNVIRPRRSDHWCFVDAGDHTAQDAAVKLGHYRGSDMPKPNLSFVVG